MAGGGCLAHAMKRNVVIGQLGTTLDRGAGPKRWERWRPTVDLFQHEDLLVDRIDLLASDRDAALVRTVIADIRQISPKTEVVLHPFEVRDPWDFEQMYAALHDFVSEYDFVDSEDYLVHITTGTHVSQICLFLLTEARFIPGRLLQTSPTSRSRDHAFAIIDLDLSRYDQIARRFATRTEESLSYLKSGIQTRSARFNALIQQLERVAIRSRDPILLMGPTGAGKSQLARRLFELKQSRHQVGGSFVEVNCATLRGDAAMSALFGHTKGAFTGAVSARQGLLRAAHNGILFLDEIGELGADEQAMLLRAIEDGTFLPVGSDKPVVSDFQLIAGTNRDLRRRTADGEFRDDLLARINTWTFELPGLSERTADIEPNIDYELEQFAKRRDTRISFNKEARDRFLKFCQSPDALWTANFRDLNAALTRMATLAPSGRIDSETVDDEIARLRASWSAARNEKLSTSHGNLEELLGTERLDRIDQFDRAQLSYVISVCRESASLSAAGRRLFDVSRLERRSRNDADRLKKYLARFGLNWAAVNDA